MMMHMLRSGLAFSGRAFDFLARGVESMHAAAYVLGVAALLSSLLALLRDRLFAHTFGAGPELDLYYAAFRIPDLVFVCVGSLVSAFVLIPELKRREDGARAYLDGVLGGFSLLAVCVSALAAWFAPELLAWLYPSLAADGSFTQLILLTRIMLLQPILLGLSNIAAAVTQSRGRFALYAASPLLYNLGIIAGAVLLYPTFGLPGLAWGVVLGATFHLGIQLPSVFADGFLRRVPRFSDMRELFSTSAISIPRALALSLSQLSFMGLTALASMLAVGSIAVFTLSYNLFNVPLAIIGASYSVAAFPVLAERFARGDMPAFVAQVSTAARHVLFWSLPTFALVVVLRAHIVRAVLGSGAFDWTDTRLTAACLALFAISLAAQGIMLLLIRGYYASGRTLTPLIVAALSALLTLATAAASIGLLHVPFLSEFAQALLRVEGLSGSSVLALPFAFSVASVFGAFVLAVHFNMLFKGFFAALSRSFFQSLTAALLAGVSAYAALALSGPISLSSTLASVFLKGLFAGTVGMLAAALTYRLLRNSEFFEVFDAIHRRLWRTAPVAASAEEREM